MSTIHCYFCGGPACKYENYILWTQDPLHPNAIEGLYSNWITPSILAMQRPSTRLLKTHNLVQVFLTAGIKSIFNLQLPNEHKSCGDGIDDRGGSGFSYVPEDWMEAGISHYAFGWPDMDVPDKSHILKVVQVMTHELEVLGGKVAVHCHAGLGRTGLTIACYLVYAQNKTPAEAIKCVRDARPKSVQTAKQQAFVHQFKDYLITLNSVYPLTISRPFFSPPKEPLMRLSEDQDIVSQVASTGESSQVSSTISSTENKDGKVVNVVVKPITFSETMENQRLFLHGLELRALWNVPKVVYVLSRQLRTTLEKSVDLAQDSLDLCTTISMFQFNSKPSTELEELMREINFGNWEALTSNIHKSEDTACWEELGKSASATSNSEVVYIELLLFWLAWLKEPLLSDKQVHSIIDICESNSSIKPTDALLNVEAFDKPLFWTINILVDFYRHLIMPQSSTTESIYRLATLMTSQRASNIPTIQTNATLLPRLSDTVNKHSHVASTVPPTKLELPTLPPKNLVAEEEIGRKRGISEPPRLTTMKPKDAKKGFNLFGMGGGGGAQLLPSAVWGITRFLKTLIEHMEVVNETRPRRREQ